MLPIQKQLSTYTWLYIHNLSVTISQNNQNKKHMYESRIYTATVAIKREGPGAPDLLNECMRVTNFFMKLLWQWNCFYWWNCKDLHNWGFLESYIFAKTERFLVCWLVQSYCSIREYWPWKWQSGGAICFPLSLWAIFGETSMELRIKIVTIIV